ncbi:ABC transporter substrate-binding protein [Virgibacillus profundi]|uniref:ABC transporter substrate-binding protein n=1 Tax=Virgibacillus profundi TaxID=2024555 RepID=A0A2A2IJ73_9BACI|nr:extracellular solute-binding protein [Virgibacillus profundi]PAV31153.1 ABC transporter substrate-binding protein [Virgibacillus profundi]PXY55336.1 ABC transporter substrate-binding protein [Virgibacillus profundi]
MKNRKLLFFAMIVLIVMLAACSNDDEASGEAGGSEEAKNNTNEEGFPIVDEQISLNFFAGQSPASNDDWNDVMIFNEYEEMTNMDIQWEMIPHASLEEKRNLALASGDLPDAFHSAVMPATDIMKYGGQGVFIPLNDLIDKYAPNFKKILEENPDVRKAITFPDGNIYGFPQMSDPEFNSYRMGPKQWINTEWLDALGMDMPQTTEEYYEYLKAVKTEDPNGNGENDEIPYGGPGIGSLYFYLQGAFGVANRGANNTNIDIDSETGEMRFFPITDGYKQLLEYMNKLYSEGLIAQNIFSIESGQYHANASEGIYGSTNWYAPEVIFGEEAGSVLEGMPALEGPEGEKGFTTLYSAALNKGSFIITSENKNPEATVRWIDHFYGDEGQKLFFMGLEGETYELNEEGEPEYMDHIMNSEEGLTYEQGLAKYLTYPGGGFPSVTSLKYFKGAESNEKALAAAELLAPDLEEEIWPGFNYTQEENDKLTSFGADIDKYVEEMRDKFISGDESLDNWDEYVETVKSMNLEEYLEIKTAAYERYQEN